MINLRGAVLAESDKKEFVLDMLIISMVTYYTQYPYYEPALLNLASPPNLLKGLYLSSCAR